jgi:hypothetical protein
MKNKSRSGPRTIAAFLVALMVLGVVAELLFRAIPAANPESWALERLRRFTPEGNPAMKQIKEQEALALLSVQADSEIGALLVPSQHATSKTLDYTYTLETDQHGFVNRDPWPEQIDAAVLGNSLIVGAGVGMDGVFTTLLAQRFPGRSFINLGTPGGGTETQFRIYERFAQSRSPKLVVATLWPVWEVDNTIKFAHWLREGSSVSFTDYRFNYGSAHPESAAKPRSKQRGGVAGLLWHSAVVRAGYLSAKALTARSPYVEQVRFPSGEKLNLSMREQQRLARGIKRAEAPDVEQLFAEPLERLRASVESHGGRLVVALVPSREELYGTESAPSLLRTIEAVKALLAARQLPVLDLYPLFRERGKDRSPFFEREMHLNAYGNQVLADGLADWIQGNGVFATNETRRADAYPGASRLTHSITVARSSQASRRR